MLIQSCLDVKAGPRPFDRALPGVKARGRAGAGRQGAGHVIRPARSLTSPTQKVSTPRRGHWAGWVGQEPGSCPRLRCMVVVLLPSALVTLTETCCPGCRPARTAASVSVSGMAVPLTAVMTSPGRRPAFAAGRDRGDADARGLAAGPHDGLRLDAQGRAVRVGDVAGADDLPADIGDDV